MRGRPDRPRTLALLLASAFLFASRPVSADIEIAVEGVPEDVANNVLIFLSLNRYRERDDLTEDLVARLHDRVEREVKQAVRPFGYYEPKVTSDVTRNGPKNWQARIHIDPGPPVILREVDVQVVGPGAKEPMFYGVIKGSTAREGERLDHAAYEKLKGDLQRTALSHGFLDAKLERNEMVVDLAQHSASIHLRLTTGQRYRFGKTEIEQDIIDPALVRRFLRYQEGQFFDTVALLRTQFALDDSQYFSAVEIIPGQRDPETLTVPIAIRASPTRKHRYSVGVGYGTDTRGRGTITWDVRRVNRLGHRARTELVYADTEKSIDLRYVIPVGDPALEQLSFDASASDEELADLDVTSFEFRPGLTQVMGRWQRVLFISASNVTTESTIERNVDNLLMPGISYALLPTDFSGGSLVFSRGLYAELTGSHSALGSDADFLRLRVRDEHVFDLTEKWHLLLRGEIGTSFVADFSELPGSQRFFAGGDQSVRGFALNELSPVDANGDKVGGRHLIVGSVEIVRDLPRNFGIATFFDIGNAVDKFGDPLEYSAGIGIRWRLPVVTLGIDVAQALSERGMSPRLHLNISPVL